MNDLHTDIERLIEQRPIPVSDIALRLVHAAFDHRSCDLRVVRDIAELDEPMDQLLASPAMSCLHAWGREGIDVLVDYAFGEKWKTKTRHRALPVLLSISLGVIPTSKTVMFLPPNWDEMPHYMLSDDTQQYCSQRVRERVLCCIGDQEGKRNLFYALGTMGWLSGWQEGDHILFDHLLDIIIDSHMILSQDLIEELDAKLDMEHGREEDLQHFLTDHPILLDPFVKVMHSKQQLGSDFITDYVLRRMNDEYILVEIENSTDALFRPDGSFTPELMTAVGQVRDFQAWVSENLEYARKKMPNITHPDGLVVIGRRRDLDGTAARRLAEENFSRRGHIKIVTYDDLLDQAHSVHVNLIAAPVVLQSRETKSI